MTVLVTGGAGYIGSQMVVQLLDQGEDVVVLDRLSTGFKWAVPDAAKLIVGDIADTPLVEKILRDHDVDAILHFAGSVVVPESVADPIGYYTNNTVASLRLIEAAVRCNVAHFIFSSTAAVYGTPEEMPVRESTPQNPESPYGSSKLMTEVMLHDAAAAHGFTYTILRYFNVAGADPAGRTGQSTKGATHLIKTASEVATGKRPGMEIFGDDYPTPDGTCVRDYIHVADLISAHALALARLRAGGQSLIANCGYGKGYSVREVIAAVERVVNTKITARISPRRAGDAVTVVADATRANTELNWTPQYDDLDLIVKHAVDWERKLGERAI